MSENNDNEMPVLGTAIISSVEEETAEDNERNSNITSDRKKNSKKNRKRKKDNSGKIIPKRGKQENNSDELPDDQAILNNGKDIRENHNKPHTDNYVNPDEPLRVGRRCVIIDGSNVALNHGRGQVFSCKGLAICIEYFKKLGHKVVAFVPEYRKSEHHSDAPHKLKKYEDSGEIVYTPSRFINGKLVVSYDGRYIVQTAAELGGIIVSRDDFRDLLHYSEQWRKTIEERLLMYTWVGNMIIFPFDPLGRDGPSLDEFLRFPKISIVFVNSSESEWNQKNQFCGWFDSLLSEKGKQEAVAAGRELKEVNYQFDVAHTSVLTRAQVTLETILKEIGQPDLPVKKSWRLNERHYGGLTGLNKAETAAKYGDDQVKIWRRSFDVPPPPMEEGHPYYDIIVKDERYKDGPSKEEFPMYESLKLTIERTLPYWNDVIIPDLKAGKRVIIAAHGNSLRGIVKHLDNLPDSQVTDLNLPTGIPFLYELDENFKPVVSMQFLGDEETVKKAMEAVAAQGKAK